MLNLPFSRMTAPLPRFLPWAGAAIAVLTFALGITSAPKVAMGALVAAVRLAGHFCETRGVALTALRCACLILLASYFVPENPINSAIR